MQNDTLKRWLALGASSAILASLIATPAYAQDAATDTVEEYEDVVITIGSRRSVVRSAADTPAPVDVITGIELRTNAADDVQELLRTAVPSYNVNTQPISDAASIVRPANLRGLSPDNTLVLVNGKRRHRGAVISFLGGGIADGSQGVDVSSIPSIALKQVTVLRDGASSQYGSDAIAGVINFVLKDDFEGGMLEGKFGSTYDGDGDNYKIGANLGFNLGDQGFFNVAAEYGETDGTVRSVVRGDVSELVGLGLVTDEFSVINNYTDDVPQYWGQPDVEDDLKLMFNTALEISPAVEVYAFGTYAERTTTGGFFYRTPYTNSFSRARNGVYRGPEINGTDSVLVGDLDGVGVGGDCPAGIPLVNGVPDAAVLASVVGDPNCFSFIETIPNGFVPRFGGSLADYSIAGGIRGEIDLGSGLRYDISAVNGQSDVDFRIENTINASLGPDTPRDFTPGGQTQTETVLNADFVYEVPTGLASDLSVAFGAEYRKEQFDLKAGDQASFALGPLSDQGFSSSSNGFGGFPNSSSNSQDSYAGYLELEADVTDQLTLIGAARYEDFSTFGDTFNYKIGGAFKATEAVTLRGTFSTGFHAPTGGQVNITNVTTQNVNGVLIDQGTLPLNTAAGQLAADFIAANNGGAGRPTLGAEDAQNISAGVTYEADNGFSLTVDAYQIKVDDRIALGANVDFLNALNALRGDTFGSVGEALTGLSSAGVINRNDFIGLDDLSQFRFFSNSFDTRTRGVDVVARYPFELAGGDSNFILAANYNDTKVSNVGEINPISAGRVQALEDLLPKLKGNATFTHSKGIVRGLVRANYYGPWDDTGNGVDDISAEVLIDAEVAVELGQGIEWAIGASNIFDNYVDENPGQLGSGQLYSEASPIGFNGGQWYSRVRLTW